MKRTLKRTLTLVLLAALTALSLGAVTFATTRVNSTVLQVTGTRTELVQLIEPVLVTAGWTTISGTGTGDVVLQSADPAGAIPAIRVRVYDSGAGVSARVSFRNIAGTQIGSDLFLVAAAAKTWRIIANEFQLFIFNTAASTTSQNWIAGGIPAVPSFLSPSVVWWSIGDAWGDGDGTDRAVFRHRLGAYGTGYNGPGSGGQHACNWNGTLLNAQPGGAGDLGQLNIVAPLGSNVAGSNVIHPTFADNSQMVSDSWFGWGTAGNMVLSNMRLVGTIYDAIVVASNATVDSTITFNGNNYFVLTIGTVVGAAANGNPAVLAVRVP